MGERAKVILNEYYAKDLLMRDTLDLDKFYTADLKLFVKVAKEEIERLNNIINELDKWIEKGIEDGKLSDIYINGMTFVSIKRQYFQMFKEKLQELKDSDKE